MLFCAVSAGAADVENPECGSDHTMAGITPLGWFAIISLVSLIGSLFVAQVADARRNRALFNIANAMTLLGAVGLLLSWLLS